MLQRALSGSGGGGTPVYNSQENIATNTNYNITIKNGFVVLQNYAYSKQQIWGEIVVQDGVVTLITSHTQFSYSYNNGVLTIKNAYTGYGNDMLVTYIYN